MTKMDFLERYGQEDEPDADEAPGAEDQAFIKKHGNENDLNAMAEALAGADVETELLRIRTEINARQQQ